MKWKIGFKDGSGNGREGVYVNGKYKYIGDWDYKGASIVDSKGNLIIGGGEFDGVDTGVLNEADAYLISKAPELLKYLKESIKFLDHLTKEKPLKLINSVESKYKKAKNDSR
jgi:hypothetical protein